MDENLSPLGSGTPENGIYGNPSALGLGTLGIGIDVNLSPSARFDVSWELRRVIERHTLANSNKISCYL